MDRGSFQEVADGVVELLAEELGGLAFTVGVAGGDHGGEEAAAPGALGCLRSGGRRRHGAADGARDGLS